MSQYDGPPPPDRGSEHRPSDPSTARPGRPVTPHSVLVVDDEPMVVRAVAQILERAGYSVVTADGPSEAEARFTETGANFDLLLTDVVMPEGGGRRLAERLRGVSPDLRVLFMSGFTEHDSVRDDRELSAPLLTKPFSAARLALAVQGVLQAET